MAARDSSRSISIKTEKYLHHHYAQGTREALIHHGITRDGPFPGDPGEKKTVCNTTDPHGRAILIRRNSKTTFSVFRDWSEEEKAFIEVQRAREQEIERASTLVESWPKSVNAFRKSALDYADASLGMLESKLVDGYGGGYRLTDDAARRFEGLIDEMIELIKTERIVMDQELRDKYTPACIRDSVKAVGGNVIPFRRRAM